MVQTHQLKGRDCPTGLKKARPNYTKPTSNIKTDGLKIRGQKKICHANTKQNKAGVFILILDKIYFRAKTVLRDSD